MKRDCLPIYSVLLVDVLGFTILIPLLPFYAEHFGANSVMIGGLASIYAVAQLFAGPWLGFLSDRFGRRRVLLLSQAGTFSSFLMMAFAPSFVWLCLARLLDGLTSGNVSVAHAYVADVTEPKERPRAFALMGTVFGVGFILGPSLSAVLFRFGYQAPILAAAFMSLLSFILTLVFVKDRRESRSRALQLPWKTLQEMFQNDRLRTSAMQLGLFATAFSLYFFGLPLFAERRLSFGPSETGVLFLIAGIASLATQLRFLKWGLGRFGPETIVKASFGVAATGYVFLTVANTAVGLGLCVVVLAIANSSLRAAITGLISKHADRDKQGVVMGSMQSVYSLADLGAPLLAGVLMDRKALSGWAVLMCSLVLGGVLLSLESSRRLSWHESP